MGFRNLIQDRFTRGIVAGTIGWFFQLLFMLPMHWVFKIAKFQYLDFIAILSFNHRPRGLWEYLFSEFIVLFLFAVFGGVFALLIKAGSSQNIRLKGAIYGGMVWFGLYTLVTLYKMEGIYKKIDFPNAFANLIGASIYGLFMAWTLLYLHRSELVPFKKIFHYHKGLISSNKVLVNDYFDTNNEEENGLKLRKPVKLK